MIRSSTSPTVSASASSRVVSEPLVNSSFAERECGDFTYEFAGFVDEQKLLHVMFDHPGQGFAQGGGIEDRRLRRSDRTM